MICSKQCDRNKWPHILTAQRVQTSTDASHVARKWSRIQVKISTLIRIQIQMSARSLQKCYGYITLPASFCRVPWKSAGDCMRNRRRFWHATHGCVAPYVDIILHRGRFWAKSAASGSVRWWCFRSCWMVLSHVMRGRPGCLLQSAGGGPTGSSWHLRCRPCA